MDNLPPPFSRKLLGDWEASMSRIAIPPLIEAAVSASQ
jgi:hypothetical protein